MEKGESAPHAVTAAVVWVEKGELVSTLYCLSFEVRPPPPLPARLHVFGVTCVRVDCFFFTSAVFIDSFYFVCGGEPHRVGNYWYGGAQREGDLCAHALLCANARVDATNLNECTALMMACELDHDQCVRELIEADASLDASEADGWTALMMACQNGHDVCVSALIEAGAGLNVTNKQRMTTALAPGEFHVDITQTLLNDYSIDLLRMYVKAYLHRVQARSNESRGGALMNPQLLPNTLPYPPWTGTRTDRTPLLPSDGPRNVPLPPRDGPKDGSLASPNWHTLIDEDVPGIVDIEDGGVNGVQIHVNYDLMEKSIQAATNLLLQTCSYWTATAYVFRVFTEWNTPHFSKEQQAVVKEYMNKALNDYITELEKSMSYHLHRVKLHTCIT